MKSLQLRGWKAFVLIAVLIAIGGKSMLSPVLAVEDKAREPVTLWLQQEIGGETARRITASNAALNTLEKAREIAGQTGPLRTVTIDDLDGRKLSGNRLMVRVNYHVGENGAPTTRYLEVQTPLLGPWTVRGESGSFRWKMAGFRL